VGPTALWVKRPIPGSRPVHPQRVRTAAPRRTLASRHDEEAHMETTADDPQGGDPQEAGSWTPVSNPRRVRV